MPGQADTFPYFVMDVRNNFCYLCKNSAVINSGARPDKRASHASISISLLCECGSKFNLYLVHTHMNRDKRIDQNMWQHVLVPIRLTCATPIHTRTHIQAHIYIYTYTRAHMSRQGRNIYQRHENMYIYIFIYMFVSVYTPRKITN